MPEILLIDDSRSALAAAEQILTEAGHTVIACLSANDAMELAGRTKVDLIITDIYMPEKDGLEVIHEASRICPGLPVLAVSSATGTKDMLRTARILGASSTLQKPFSRQSLLQAVSEALGTRFVAPESVSNG